MGAGVGAGKRQSMGRTKMGSGRGDSVLMSAKKRARQSEYARRRSRVGGSTIGAGVDGASRSRAMDVDA